jgi:hypothetical protein
MLLYQYPNHLQWSKWKILKTDQDALIVYLCFLLSYPAFRGLLADVVRLVYRLSCLILSCFVLRLAQYIHYTNYEKISNNGLGCGVSLQVRMIQAVIRHVSVIALRYPSSGMFRIEDNCIGGIARKLRAATAERCSMDLTDLAGFPTEDTYT